MGPDCRWVRKQLSRYVVAVRSGSRDAAEPFDGLDVRVSFLIVLWQAHDKTRLPDCRWVRKQLSRYVVALRSRSRDAAEPFDGIDVRMSFLIVLWQAHDEARLPMGAQTTVTLCGCRAERKQRCR